MATAITVAIAQACSVAARWARKSPSASRPGTRTAIREAYGRNSVDTNSSRVSSSQAQKRTSAPITPRVHTATRPRAGRPRDGPFTEGRGERIRGASWAREFGMEDIGQPARDAGATSSPELIIW